MTIANAAFSSSSSIVNSKGHYRNIHKNNKQYPTQLQAVVRMDKNNNPEDMSGLFPGDGPYVPAGLSAEQYQRIKQEEAKKLKKMEFGAWGPRFKRTDVPDGDWMVMPSLWTNGVNARARPQPVGMDGDNNNSNSGSIHVLQRIKSLLQNKGPGFVLACVLLQYVTSSIAMYHAKTSEAMVRKSVWSIFKYGLLKMKSFYVLTVAQTQIAKLAIASCFAPAMNAFLENTNRRKLWTKRRTILTTSASGMMALFAWASLVFFLPI